MELTGLAEVSREKNDTPRAGSAVAAAGTGGPRWAGGRTQPASLAAHTGPEMLSSKAMLEVTHEG